MLIRPDDIAKFTPALVSVFFVKMPLIIPSNSPLRLTKAPPDEPGFAAASVCTKSSISLKPMLLKPVADITPQVIPIFNPKLLLIRQALLPILGFSVLIAIGRNSNSVLSNARSVEIEFLIILAENNSPLISRTFTSVAFEITCDAVSISPSDETIIPVPSGAVPGGAPNPGLS